MNNLAGQSIKGYELTELIGAGGFGEVYRAHQLSIKRDVAIKIILPKFANHPDFVRRFETEAQLIARLEHLHIVPLYDYWREPDRAYLVMRWLQGGSLRDSLDRGPWEIDLTAHMLDQVGAALAVAHQHGVIHRDLKPDNILLDEEGNAYLTDFGIAKDLESGSEITRADAITGSPGYISPEQVQSGPISPQTDIYSLGVMLFELLAGEHPFPGETSANLFMRHLQDPLPPLQEVRPDLSPHLDKVIQRATAKDPTARYSDVVALATEFRMALASDMAISTTERKPLEGTPAIPELALQNPFKGLRAFEAADADDFFGREDLIAQLLARLGEEGEAARFLAVVGPSGSGKSSVVKAGLLPALRRGALPGSDKWFVVEMLPGARPLEELEIGLLRIAVNPSVGIADQLQRDERGLLRAARLALPSEDNELLLIIDQFEELFTLVEDKGETAHFLNSLYTAVTDPRSPLHVVITLRADFYDRPLMHTDFGGLVEQRTQVVLPLTAEELGRAIREPAEQAGATLGPGLVTEIVADVVEQPGALPLLQYAMTELFERREGQILTRKTYEEIGGVLGALGRRAEEVYIGLDNPEQAAARQLFLRLVTLGEGVEDTRRRVLRTELEALTIEDHQSSITRIIDAFGQARLLSFDRDPLTRGPTVEVAHEALLREWRRLREWFDASRADVRLQRLLGNGAAGWLEADRDPSYLLLGSRLDQFEAWAAGTELALTETERAYLDASLEERRGRQSEEEARRAREAAQERRSRNFLRALVGVFAVATVIALFLSNFAFNQRSIAEQQTRLAAARELAAAALTNLQVDPERSILMALEAVKTTYAEDQTTVPEAETVLHQAVSASHLLYTLRGHVKESSNWASFVEFSPDGSRLATGHSGDEAAIVWDVATGQELLYLSHFKGGFPGIFGLAFSPDGKNLATNHQGEQTTKIWDSATGQELFTLSGGHIDWTMRIAYDPDGTRIAVGSFDSTATVWDVDTGEQLLTLAGHTGPVWDVAFTPDGSRLVTSDDRTAWIWDANIGEKLFTVAGHTATVWGVTINPDGSLLATASADGTAKIWDIATGQELLRLTDHTDSVNDVAFSTDGARLATVSGDGTAKVWDLTTGKELLTLAGHTDQVLSVAFSPDGTRLATSSIDQTAKVWDLSPDHETLGFFSGTVYDFVFSPDGRRLATSSARGTATVWDAGTGQALLTVSDQGHTQPLNEVEFSLDQSRLAPGVDFSPDGTRLALASSDKTARIWDATTGPELLTLTGHTDFVNGIVFSPDGAYLATASEDNTAKIRDAATGEELFTLSGHTEWVRHIVFSPNGKLLVTSSPDDTARVWDTATGQELLVLTGHNDKVTYAAFSPDDARLATASGDGTAKVWDVGTGQELLTLSGHTNVVNSITYSADGMQLATASSDGTTKVWDATTGEVLLTLSTQPVGVN